jgi:hypothetical protein
MYRGCTLLTPGNLLCTKSFRLFFFYDLVRKGIKSSIQVFERTEDFVDFTLYYNGYYDFIGKNLLLCPNNKILKKNDTIRVIKWFNFFFEKTTYFLKTCYFES